MTNRANEPNRPGLPVSVHSFSAARELPRRKLVVHEGRNQPQEGLVLWIMRPTAEKGADVEIRYLPARWGIRFVPDEYPIGLGVPAQ